jgi:hypothetical protein
VAARGRVVPHDWPRSRLAERSRPRSAAACRTLPASGRNSMRPARRSRPPSGASGTASRHSRSRSAG